MRLLLFWLLLWRPTAADLATLAQRKLRQREAFTEEDREFWQRFLPRQESSMSPVPQPTPRPTPRPTRKPTKAPTKRPTPAPTLAPTTAPTPRPTQKPTRAPSPRPTTIPTKEPTREPTPRPTRAPTAAPTPHPTQNPTPRPTPRPTAEPTPQPTPRPTPSPIVAPTPRPTRRTTSAPTSRPTPRPTPIPTPQPTPVPTRPNATSAPTRSPTNVPTDAPTDAPTPRPNPTPTAGPTMTMVPPTPAPMVQTPAPTVSVAPTLAPVTLLALIRSTPEFSTLSAAIDAADRDRNTPPLLAAALDDPNAQFTAFAPVNAAFDNVESLVPGYLEQLLTPAFSQHLFSILAYHVTNGIVPTSSYPLTGLPMLTGDTIDIQENNGSFQAISASPLPATLLEPGDFSALNGIAQVVDNVLLPQFVVQNPLEALQSLGDVHSTFLRLVEASGVDIASLEGVTLLAPTNDAIRPETEEFLLQPENQEELVRVIQYHVITSLFNCAVQTVPNVLLVQTLEGENIIVGLIFLNENISVSFNQATRLGLLLSQQNLIYQVDTMLVPPTLSTVVPRSIQSMFASTFVVELSYSAEDEEDDLVFVASGQPESKGDMIKSRGRFYFRHADSSWNDGNR